MWSIRLHARRAVQCSAVQCSSAVATTQIVKSEITSKSRASKHASCYDAAHHVNKICVCDACPCTVTARKAWKRDSTRPPVPGPGRACTAIHATHAIHACTAIHATHAAQRALTVLPRNPPACLSTAPLSASTCNGDRAFRTTTNPLRSNRNRARSSSATLQVPSIVPEGTVTEDAVDIVDSSPARRAHALAARMHFLVSEHAVNPRARNSRAAPPKTPVVVGLPERLEVEKWRLLE
jgi:hypothetical protein